jgi:hypothetical protein
MPSWDRRSPEWSVLDLSVPFAKTTHVYAGRKRDVVGVWNIAREFEVPVPRCVVVSRVGELERYPVDHETRSIAM